MFGGQETGRLGRRRGFCQNRLSGRPLLSPQHGRRLLNENRSPELGQLGILHESHGLRSRRGRRFLPGRALTRLLHGRLPGSGPAGTAPRGLLLPDIEFLRLHRRRSLGRCLRECRRLGRGGGQALRDRLGLREHELGPFGVVLREVHGADLAGERRNRVGAVVAVAQEGRSLLQHLERLGRVGRLPRHGPDPGRALRVVKVRVDRARHLQRLLCVVHGLLKHAQVSVH